MEAAHEPGKRRLLVVEDDHELRTVLERSARRHCGAVEVDWAEDLRAASRLLQTSRYDAVLADYVLSESERGTEVARLCRSWGQTGPIAIMSATPLPELMDRVRDPEMRLLPKPFTTKEFAAFVEGLLAPGADGAA